MKTESGVWVWRWTVIVCLAVVLSLIGSLIYLLREPPVAVTVYESPLITTNKTPLCPGDKVVYDQVSHISDAPVMLTVVESVWNVDLNKNALSDDHSFKVNIPAGYTGGRSHLEWVVPPLPAGHYKLLRSTTAQGRQSQMFAVTFEVKAGCKK